MLSRPLLQPSRFVALFLLAAPAFAADASATVRAKLDLFEDHRLKPGQVVVFTPVEINAWAREAAPQGIRNPSVQLGSGTAVGTAIVDFLKIRQTETNPILAKLIEGERPLSISVRLQSAGGKCTVYLTRVELSGVAASGGLLDFLIKTFFLPLYPQAKIGEPFDLDYDIERIEIQPSGVYVRIKK